MFIPLHQTCLVVGMTPNNGDFLQPLLDKVDVCYFFD